MPHCEAHSNSEPHIRGEMMWTGEDGNVHSDICINAETSIKARKLLHDMLDEWIDNWGGDGLFYLGDPDYQDTYTTLFYLKENIGRRHEKEKGLFTEDTFKKINMVIDSLERIIETCERTKHLSH